MRVSTPLIATLGSSLFLLSVCAEDAQPERRLSKSTLGNLLGGIEDSTGLTYLEASTHLIDHGDTKGVPKGVVQELVGDLLKEPVDDVVDKLDKALGGSVDKLSDVTGLDTVLKGVGLRRRDDPLSLGEIEDKSGLTYLETAAHLVNHGDTSKVKPGVIQEVGSKLAGPVNAVAANLNDLSGGNIEKVADKVGLTDVLMGAGLRRAHRRGSVPRRLAPQ